MTTIQTAKEKYITALKILDKELTHQKTRRDEINKTIDKIIENKQQLLLNYHPNFFTIQCSTKHALLTSKHYRGLFSTIQKAQTYMKTIHNDEWDLKIICCHADKHNIDTLDDF